MKDEGIIAKTFKVNYGATGYDIIAIKKLDGTTIYYHFYDGSLARMPEKIMIRMGKEQFKKF